LNPTIKLRVRQIERLVKVPLPSVISYTKELTSEKILKITEIGGIKLYSADRSSKNFLLEKSLFNLKSLFDSNLINFLIESLNNPLIIVFGSYSKGEDVETSDIDFYIECVSNFNVDLKSFEKKLNRKIEIFHYQNINKIKNKDLANNIINGITLNGFLEVLK